MQTLDKNQKLIEVANRRDEAHRRYAYLCERGYFTDYSLMQVYLDAINELEAEYQKLKAELWEFGISFADLSAQSYLAT